MEEELDGRLDRALVFADQKARWDSKGLK